jgi:hypothetical protein
MFLAVLAAEAACMPAISFVRKWDAEFFSQKTKAFRFAFF